MALTQSELEKIVESVKTELVEAMRLELAQFKEELLEELVRRAPELPIASDEPLQPAKKTLNQQLKDWW